MSADAAGLSIVWPAFVAGLLVTATHAPLGIHVLRRGIVFIDLAVAQIAGLGVIVAHWLGFDAHGVVVQAAAFSAAIAGALLLHWTDKRWPEVQEAVIGVTFILAANAAILLLAANPRGAEHLKDLLIGQILWVDPQAMLIVAIVYAGLLFAWRLLGSRSPQTVFYVVFAIAVTISVQLVGLYLVFTTLIVPALATRHFQRWRVGFAFLVGALGYALGLALSLLSDLPAGPLVVCAMIAVGLVPFALTPNAFREPA